MSWLLALTGLAAEGDVVRRWPEPAGHRVTDIVELLATARPELAHGVAVSPRFPQLDREAVFRIRAEGLPCLGLLDPGDDPGEQVLRDWGLEPIVVTPDLDLAPLLLGQTEPAHACPLAPVVAVTGAAGAPGITTVAVGVALGWPGAAVLLDADELAPAVGFSLRQTGATLRSLARQSASRPLLPRDVLAVAAPSGSAAVITHDAGEPMTLSAAQSVLAAIRRTGRPVVVDCGWGPVPGGSHVLRAEVLAQSDVIVSVAAATPLGIRRWIDGSPELRSHEAAKVVVWRGDAVGRRLERRLAAVVAAARPEAEVSTTATTGDHRHPSLARLAHGLAALVSG